MSSTKKMLKYPSYYYALGPMVRDVLDVLLEKLVEIESVKCVFWGGSTSLAGWRSPDSDVDLWAVVTKNPKSVKHALQCGIEHLREVSYTYDGGHLPWLGDFLSVYFFPTCTFSVDIGFCSPNELPTTNPGPTPFFIYGASKRGSGLHF